MEVFVRSVSPSNSDLCAVEEQSPCTEQERELNRRVLRRDETCQRPPGGEEDQRPRDRVVSQKMSGTPEHGGSRAKVKATAVPSQTDRRHGRQSGGSVFRLCVVENGQWILPFDHSPA